MDRWCNAADRQAQWVFLLANCVAMVWKACQPDRQINRLDGRHTLDKLVVGHLTSLNLNLHLHLNQSKIVSEMNWKRAPGVNPNRRLPDWIEMNLIKAPLDQNPQDQYLIGSRPKNFKAIKRQPHDGCPTFRHLAPHRKTGQTNCSCRGLYD